MKKLRSIFIIIVIFVLYSNKLKAQQAEDLLYFSNIPQNVLYNPAMNTSKGLYLSIPVISSLGLSLNSSGFAWNDLFAESELEGYGIHIDADGFIKKLKKTNYINLGIKDNLFGFGFSIGKNRFAFNVTFNLETRLTFSKSLFEMLNYGTYYFDKDYHIFEDKFFELSSYLAPTLSYTRIVNDKLTLGLGLKYYLGLLNISSKQTSVDVYSNESKIYTTAHIEVNNANVIQDLTDEEIFSDGDLFIKGASVSKAVQNAMKNKGFGIDLGASYKITNKIEVSASVVDLGFIKWKSNTATLINTNRDEHVLFDTMQTEYEDAISYFEAIQDTLSEVFDLENNANNGYTTMLPTKIYLGFDYEFLKHNHINALYKMRVLNGKIDNVVMLNYKLEFKRFEFSIGNSFGSTMFNPNAYISFLNCFYVGANISTFGGYKNTSGASVVLGLNIKI